MRVGIVVAFIACAVTAGAQNSAKAARTGRRTQLPVADEVALARSAAPGSVSDSATIYVLTDSGYVVAAKGSWKSACYVDRSWSLSIEPHCFDAEGAATVMRMHMRKSELLHRGKTEAEADADVNAALAEGRFRLPQRPAMSYMMSAHQVLYSDEGVRVGAWQPHVMIYYPFLRTADIGVHTPDAKAAIIASEGRADASIMIVVKDFIQRGASPPR